MTRTPTSPRTLSRARVAATVIPLGLTAALLALPPVTATAATTEQAPTTAATPTQALARGKAPKAQVTDIVANPAGPLTGEKTKFTARTMNAKKGTTVTFAYAKGKKWATAGTSRVKKNGTAVYKTPITTTPGSQTWRATFGTTKKATRNARMTQILVIRQQVQANAPDTAPTGEPIGVAFNLTPTRKKQTIDLEANTGNGWDTVATTTATPNGQTGAGTLIAPASVTNGTTVDLRVVARSYKGSTEQTSPTLTVTLTDGDGGGGETPTGDTVVLSQAASDAVTGYDPATGKITVSDTRLLPALTKGDVVVFRPSTAIPGGALRTITAAPAARTASGDPDAPAARATGTYTTTSASLVDAITDTTGLANVQFAPHSTTVNLLSGEVTDQPEGAPGDIVGSALTINVERFIPDTNFEDILTGTWRTSVLPRFTFNTTDGDPNAYSLAFDVWEDHDLRHDILVRDNTPEDTKTYDQKLGTITRVFEGTLTGTDATIPVYVTATWELRMQIRSRGANADMLITHTLTGDPTGDTVRTLEVAADLTGTPAITSTAQLNGITGDVEVTKWTGTGGGARINAHTALTTSLYDLTTGSADLGYEHDMTRVAQSGGFRCTIDQKATFTETALIADLARKVLGSLPGTKAMLAQTDPAATDTYTC